MQSKYSTHVWILHGVIFWCILVKHVHSFEVVFYGWWVTNKIKNVFNNPSCYSLIFFNFAHCHSCRALNDNCLVEDMWLHIMDEHGETCKKLLKWDHKGQYTIPGYTFGNEKQQASMCVSLELQGLHVLKICSMCVTLYNNPSMCVTFYNNPNTFWSLQFAEYFWNVILNWIIIAASELILD